MICFRSRQNCRLQRTVLHIDYRLTNHTVSCLIAEQIIDCFETANIKEKYCIFTICIFLKYFCCQSVKSLSIRHSGKRIGLHLFCHVFIHKENNPFLLVHPEISIPLHFLLLIMYGKEILICSFQLINDILHRCIVFKHFLILSIDSGLFQFLYRCRIIQIFFGFQSYIFPGIRPQEQYIAAGINNTNGFVIITEKYTVNHAIHIIHGYIPAQNITLYMSSNRILEHIHR